MDKEFINLMANIAAMKLLLGRLYSMVYTFAKLTPEQVLDAHKLLRESLPKQTLVQAQDPAMSDLFSSEIAAEIDRFLLGVEKTVGAVPKEP